MGSFVDVFQVISELAVFFSQKETEQDSTIHNNTQYLFKSIDIYF